jgi:uncharacterized Tic20 family protein
MSTESSPSPVNIEPNESSDKNELKFHQLRSIVHASGALGVLIPFAELAVGLYLWLTKVDKNPEIKKDIEQLFDFSFILLILKLLIAVFFTASNFFSNDELDIGSFIYSFSLLNIIRIVIICIYLIQSRRAFLNKKTSYPVSYPITKKIIRLIDKD